MGSFIFAVYDYKNFLHIDGGRWLSLTVYSVNTFSIDGAIVFHFTFIYFGNRHAYTIVIFLVPRATNTMKLRFWQGKTIRWFRTGIIYTNAAFIIEPINSTPWIEPSGMPFWAEFRLWGTFAVCKMDGLFRSAFREPFRISFVFARKLSMFLIASLT